MYHYFVWTLMQPFTPCFLLTMLGLMNLWRKRQESKRRLLMVTLPFAGMLLSCFPPLAYLMKGSLEWEYPPLDDRPSEIQAIIVLSSSVYEPDAIRHEPEMDADTMYRCLKAVAMYQQGQPCPIVVCGGRVNEQRPGPTNAAVMCDFLVQLAIPRKMIELEEISKSTYENAVEAHKLLEPRGLLRVLLITDANHLPRSVKCFRKQGFEVVPCGVQYRATQSSAARTSLLPQSLAALDQEIALHEWIGMFWYWLNGRI